MKRFAPWPPGAAEALNAWQECGWVHPLTCSGELRDRPHPKRSLLATVEGWVCSGCGGRQFWAHDFMFRGAPPHPLEHLRG